MLETLLPNFRRGQQAISTQGVPCVLADNISFARTLSITCLLSFAMHATSLSLTPSAARLIHGPLTITSRLLEESVSSDERITLMAALISMLSSISDENSEAEGPGYLMFLASIRTLRHLEEARRVVTTTRSRMETWSQEGSSGQAGMRLAEMAANGARLSALRVSQSFGQTLNGWIRRHFVPTTGTSENLPIGVTNPSPRYTSIPEGSILSLEWYLTWLNGESSLLVML